MPVGMAGRVGTGPKRNIRAVGGAVAALAAALAASPPAAGADDAIRAGPTFLDAVATLGRSPADETARTAAHVESAAAGDAGAEPPRGAGGEADPCVAPWQAEAPALTPAAEPTGTPAGLLLGGRSDGELRTVLVTRSGGSVETLSLDGVLISPQPDGFWLIEMREASNGRRAVVRPLDTPGGGAGAAEDDPDRPPWRDTILTVAQGALCVRSEARWSAGGAHPTHLESAGCWRLAPGQAPIDREPLRVRAYFDHATETEARNRLREKHRRGVFRDAPASAKDVVGPLEAERLRLMLHHRRGRLMAFALAEASAPYALSPTYRVELSASLGPAPASLAPYNERPVEWAKVREVFPDARHAFVSPGGGLAAVLADDALFVLAAPEGRVAHCEPIEITDVAVAEWATGSAALRWRRTLSGLQPKP